MNSLKSKASSMPEAPVAAAEAGSPNLSRWMWLILLLVVAGVVAGLVPRWLHRRELGKETLELSVPTVQVISAVPGKASASLTLPAEVRPFVEAPIYARASGFLTNWYFDIGAHVDAGQLMARIDAPELQQQLTGAKAELAQAEAAGALAKTTAERWAGLLKTSSVSEQEDAEKQSDLKLKLAAVDTARANVRRLEEIESFTRVTAPFPGVVTTRLIDVGDLISSGKELFRLSDTSKLRVFVRVPQTATPGISMGGNAELTVPELPARKFAAKVVRTAGAIDASSRTLLTELEVDNSKNEILSGSYAQVNFADLKQDPALVLPSNTLLFRGEGMQVGVVGPDGHVALHDIKIGRDFGKTVEVVSGITGSDKVIMNPSDSLVSGAVVRIVDAPAGESER